MTLHPYEWVDRLNTCPRNDELQAGRLNCFDTLLNNMVAILVLDALQHIAIQLLDDKLLLVQWYGLQGLLDDSSAVHL
jgi:hypothetical protein